MGCGLAPSVGMMFWMQAYLRSAQRELPSHRERWAEAPRRSVRLPTAARLGACRPCRLLGCPGEAGTRWQEGTRRPHRARGPRRREAAQSVPWASPLLERWRRQAVGFLSPGPCRAEPVGPLAPWARAFHFRFQESLSVPLIFPLASCSLNETPNAR